MTRIAEIEKELNDLTLGNDDRRIELLRERNRLMGGDPNRLDQDLLREQGVSGYYKTDWTWGRNIAKARQIAEEMNAKMGITPRDATLIQLSTMRRTV